MIHPLLDQATNRKRTHDEAMEEDPAKDTAKQQKDNPAVHDVPVNPRVDMEQASDFWKDVIDGMAAFEIDIEREHKRHLQARQSRLQQARSQQEAFWSRFRNTPRYYQLMRQRQDAAHAFRAHIKKTRDEATSQGTTFQPASFRQFAAETNHPALQESHPQTRRTAVSPRNVSYADPGCTAILPPLRLEGGLHQEAPTISTNFQNHHSQWHGKVARKRGLHCGNVPHRRYVPQIQN